MRVPAARMPIAGTARSALLLLAFASSAVVAVDHVLAAKVPLGPANDPLAALDVAPAVAAAAIGIGGGLVHSRGLSAGFAAAMALSLILAASAALLHAAFATGFAAAISSVSAVVFLALALLALDVALRRFAPGRVKRS
jgi:hypothetical protein